MVWVGFGVGVAPQVVFTLCVELRPTYACCGVEDLGSSVRLLFRGTAASPVFVPDIGRKSVTCSSPAGRGGLVGSWPFLGLWPYRVLRRKRIAWLGVPPTAMARIVYAGNTFRIWGNRIPNLRSACQDTETTDPVQGRSGSLLP